MPVVSTFYGIVIRMFYREHGVPHFHAEYWSLAKGLELEANWARAKAGESLERIAPLE